jgi:hypothetical protein
MASMQLYASFRQPARFEAISHPLFNSVEWQVLMRSPNAFSTKELKADAAKTTPVGIPFRT